MKKRSIFSGILFLTFILTACGGNAPASTPTVDPSAVAALVATMMAGNSTVTPTVTSTPEVPTVLPRSLYYLAQDINGMGQIYRLDRDGVTITQITFEQDGVNNFDVSPIDSAIVYPVQNSLITVGANGENREVLVQDPNTGYLRNPIWSLDGKTIVYGSGKDVVIYSFTTGNNETVISGSDNEANSPVSFSPDSRKLIIMREIVPSIAGPGMSLIYDFDSQMLTSIGQDNTPFSCFAGITWTTSNNFLCFSYVFAGPTVPGLWRVNAEDGSVETLIFSESCPPCLPVAAPHLQADGNLYYLYSEVENVNNTYPSLSLVSSNADGVTDRTTLRPETFNVSHAKWTPNGDALLIAQNDGIGFSPTNLILVPVNPSVPIVTIMADASAVSAYSLRWGP